MDTDDKVAFLAGFRGKLLDHSEGRFEEGQDFDRMTDMAKRHRAMKKFEATINEDVELARRLIADAGISTTTKFWHKGTGGGGWMVADALDSMFEDVVGRPILDKAIAIVDRAIGTYKAMATGSIDLLVGGKDTADIEGAIERTLRPAFRMNPPANEKDVQDVVENILNTLGLDFTREKDRVVVVERAFIPDFALDSLGLAVEVKFAREGLTASKLQEQMAADITAYKLRWNRLLFVVYDMGVIADPDRFRRENMKHFGVSVVIVKH